MAASEYVDGLHAEITRLRAALATSEERAERAERRLTELTGALEWIDQHVDGPNASDRSDIGAVALSAMMPHEQPPASGGEGGRDR